MDSRLFFVALFWISVICGIAYVVHSRRDTAKKNALNIKFAEANYQESLKRLKQNPTDADTKQSTLRLGRAYSARLREHGAVTVFDEVALRNDLEAACAGATKHSPASTSQSHPKQNAPVSPQQSSLEDRLAKLNDLKRKGLIDEQDYRSNKQKLLDEI